MKIFDDLIPKEFQNKVKEAYFNNDFPWYMMNKVANINKKFIFKNSLITNEK